MVNSEMFLPLKSIFLKINLKKIIFFGSILFLGLFLFSLVTDNCGIENLILLGDVRTLEDSFDPEHCEYVVEKINLFNDKCESQVEILDCG